jgi:hypothetical protein
MPGPLKLELNYPITKLLNYQFSDLRSIYNLPQCS